MTKTFTYNSPAKINLFLRIVEKRSDGFHNLETLFYPIPQLHDTLQFTKSNSKSFESNISELGFDENNLIFKAINLLEEKTKKVFNLAVKIEKRIPIGAGLGGGSSNAATTLKAVNEIFNLNFTKEELIKFSLELGSDVPFFIESKPALGFGRGEILKHLDIKFDFPLLIVNPRIHVSTKEAFSFVEPKPTNIDWEKEIKSEVNFNLFSNDFEKSVFNIHNKIGLIKKSMYKNNAIFATMTGTGSTVFGFFKSKNDLNTCKLALPKNYLLMEIE